MSDPSALNDLLGTGDYRYQPVIDWPQIPSDITLVEAIGVAVDSEDRVYVFNRGGEPSVLIFLSDGQFVEAWKESSFERPHGICVSFDDTVYLTDDLGHCVSQFSRDGRLLRNIGPTRQPSDTGVEGFDYRSITSAGPYNLPTNVAIAEDGHVFVSDGYGNARIHHFDRDARLIDSWGAAGDGPGQFNVPHGVCVDALGRVLVADRENSRIQVFDRGGALQQQWTDVIRPCQVFASDEVYYVAELGNQNGRFPWQPKPEQPTGGRVSIFDRDGRLMSRWGGGLDARRPDSFYACHDICTDSQGNIYVGEVAVTAATAAGEDPTGLPTLRKFVRA